MSQIAVKLPHPAAAPARRRRELTAGRLIIHFGLLLCALAFLAPLLLVAAASVSSEKSITDHGYSFWPQQFSARAYRYILGDPSKLVQAYGVSIFVTAVGTVISMLIMALLAYALSRADFFARKPLSFYVLFTMLFSGGLVPSYILMTRYLHLANNIFALILPYLVIPWSVLLLRTYFAGLPRDVIDAARVDGAGEWRTFFSVVVPLSGPALATIGMFTMLMYWNDWWLGLLYMDNANLSPVQLWLYRILSNVDAISSNPQLGQVTALPVQSLRMAVAVLAIGPIIIAFVFAQRYFVRGITVGGIRG
jgi:putative aldouronate transport system permease protein